MKENMTKLSVNLDHIATLRQARREHFPDPLHFAKIAQKASCDGITIHLREDRRHIQDEDIFLFKKNLTIPLNLEISMNFEMRQIALALMPQRVTFVPERREELTTEGGLDLARVKDLKEAIQSFQDKGIEVSLFIDPIEVQLQLAKQLNVFCVELHTGSYACCLPNSKEQKKKRDDFAKIVDLAQKLNLIVHAGHGLNYHNVTDIASLSAVKELSIGFAIIVHSLEVGFFSAVKEMILLLKSSC